MPSSEADDLARDQTQTRVSGEIGACSVQVGTRKRGVDVCDDDVL